MFLIAVAQWNFAACNRWNIVSILYSRIGIIIGQVYTIEIQMFTILSI